MRPAVAVARRRAHTSLPRARSPQDLTRTAYLVLRRFFVSLAMVLTLLHGL